MLCCSCLVLIVSTPLQLYSTVPGGSDSNLEPAKVAHAAEEANFSVFLHATTVSMFSPHRTANPCLPIFQFLAWLGSIIICTPVGDIHDPKCPSCRRRCQCCCTLQLFVHVSIVHAHCLFVQMSIVPAHYLFVHVFVHKSLNTGQVWRQMRGRLPAYEFSLD